MPTWLEPWKESYISFPRFDYCDCKYLPWIGIRVISNWFLMSSNEFRLNSPAVGEFQRAEKFVSPKRVIDYFTNAVVYRSESEVPGGIKYMQLLFFELLEPLHKLFPKERAQPKTGRVSV